MTLKDIQDNKYNYKYLILLIMLYTITFPLVGLSLHKPVSV